MFLPFLKLRKYGFASKILMLPSLLLSFWVLMLFLIITGLVKIETTVGTNFKVFVVCQIIFYLLFFGAYPKSTKYEFMKEQMCYTPQQAKKSILAIIFISLILLITFCPLELAST